MEILITILIAIVAFLIGYAKALKTAVKNVVKYLKSTGRTERICFMMAEDILKGKPIK